jgi:hypothetical protein
MELSEVTEEQSNDDEVSYANVFTSPCTEVD